jgi:hypothetical protein
MRRRSLLGGVVIALIGLVIAASSAGAGSFATSAARKIVVHGQFRSLSKDKRTITYIARNGTYSATWIGVRHYRLKGKIGGRRLTGTMRTHQARSGDRYIAKGSGRLGSRRVRITGGGPNNLKTSTLVLS